MAILLQQDLATIEAGLYPLPADHDGSLLTLLHRSRLFFDDLPATHRRRESSAHHEVLTERTRGRRPPYYFHFQTGGWMTDDSARRYDTQVEVLFNGTANATRRQALPQLEVDIGGADLARGNRLVADFQRLAKGLLCFARSPAQVPCGLQLRSCPPFR